MMAIATMRRLAVVWIVVLTTAVEAQIKILQPESLVQSVGNEGRIAGVTTTLAAPTYEQTVIGLLYYTPDNVTSHCSADAYSLQESDASTTLAKIVVVHRDRRCSLKKKVLVAQSKGADAVLIIDPNGTISEASFLRMVFTSGSAEPGRVTIPSVVVRKEMGERLAAAALNQTGKDNLIAVNLRWDVPDQDSVSLYLGMNSGALKVESFLQHFAPKRMKLNDLLSFTPAYDIMGKDDYLALWRRELDDQQKHVILQSDCIGPEHPHDMFKLDFESGETYCAKDPDGTNPIKGRDVVMQDLLHYCVWQVHRRPGRMSEAFWRFVAELPSRCPLASGYSIDCAHKLLGGIEGVDKNLVRQCEQDGGSILEEQRAGKDWDAAPYVQINGWRYSGPLDAEEVFRAICHGYPLHRLPDPCRDLFEHGTGPDQPGTNTTAEEIAEALKRIVGANLTGAIKELEKALAELRRTTTTPVPASTTATTVTTTIGTTAQSTTPRLQDPIDQITPEHFKMMWMSIMLVIVGLFCALLIAAVGCGMCLQARMIQSAAMGNVNRAPLLGEMRQETLASAGNAV